ncbi:unnamed protein product [Protopolystoma xenopodis]|uniref:Uncharacterized protein n=1 Tax=Protopolystoma xenopodis TaxID=117903 RepID=A0A3S5AF08_9PLAT|nr:unnamed protein product [Protopolystoma xenopodis]
MRKGSAARRPCAQSAESNRPARRADVPTDRWRLPTLAQSQPSLEDTHDMRAHRSLSNGDGDGDGDCNGDCNGEGDGDSDGDGEGEGEGHERRKDWRNGWRDSRSQGNTRDGLDVGGRRGPTQCSRFFTKAGLVASRLAGNFCPRGLSPCRRSGRVCPRIRGNGGCHDWRHRGDST